jgi:hypothetical protein
MRLGKSARLSNTDDKNAGIKEQSVFQLSPRESWENSRVEITIKCNGIHRNR